jgi:C-terminal processing protease CtpA/Prc
MRNLQAWKAVAVAACAALALAGCGGGGGSGAGSGTVPAAVQSGPASCAVADQQAWLRAYMADQYYWYANLGAASESASSMDGYFRSLLYTAIDRYSYSQPAAVFSQFYAEGQRTGYGYSLAWADAARTVLKVAFVEPLSPVGLAGLRRGDTIVAIDGYTPAQIVAGSLAAVDTAGVPRSFSIQDGAGNPRSFSVASASYTLSPVPVGTTFDVATGAGSVKTGYLAYQEFIAGSAPALGSAFAGFAAAGVKELILDLRYNGGGSVTVARNLASMVGGTALGGQTFAQLRFNALHPEQNVTYAFTANPALLPAPPLAGLGRVFVITSASTASASELVINSLKPFMNVVLVGGTTYGKPYGFQPRDACGLTYSAVNFDSVNAQGVGGYSNGIAANCVVADDLGHQLGDMAEGRTAAAVAYIQTGNCPAGTAALQARQAPAASAGSGGGLFGETVPPQMFAD